MRDMVACFSEHAVRVSETTCSSYANHLHHHHHHHHHLPPIPQNTPPSASFQTAVTSLYNITLSTNKHLLVTVTWSSTQMGHQGLTIAFGDDPSSPSLKLSTTSRLFRKKKGARSIDLDDSSSKVELLWDLSEVNYESGVEPVDGYYIVIIIDSELGLVLGDLCSKEAVSKKIKNGSSLAKSCLVSRREHYSGAAVYSTKAQFSDNGAIHDISIRCSSGESEGLKQPVLSVSMDKRTVMRVKRLQWNFRGNQTIFIDGLLIDLFWDVHDWFFSPGNGLAVFMFRRRSSAESRLWLEEKVAPQKKQEDQEKPPEFSLFIYASKSP